jgi:putative membrane protein, TIGR04086 family/integral membrane protein, TIGR04097 family
MKTVAEAKQVKARGYVTPVLWGILGAFVASILLLALFSILMTVRDMPNGVISPFACVSISFGAAFGGFITTRLFQSRGLVMGMITGFIFFITLYLAGIIVQQAELNGLLLLKVSLSVVFGGIGGISGVNMRSKRSRNY